MQAEKPDGHMCWVDHSVKLSAMVSSANWKIDDQNYYRQFAELSRKNQNLL